MLLHLPNAKLRTVAAVAFQAAVAVQAVQHLDPQCLCLDCTNCTAETPSMQCADKMYKRMIAV